MTDTFPIREVPIKLEGVGRNLDRYCAAVWDYDGKGRAVFGLTYEGRRTHMAYGLDYFDPIGALEWCDRKGAPFLFDAGGNGRPLKASRDELERALRALGLIPEEGE